MRILSLEAVYYIDSRKNFIITAKVYYTIKNELSHACSILYTVSIIIQYRHQWHADCNLFFNYPCFNIKYCSICELGSHLYTGASNQLSLPCQVIHAASTFWYVHGWGNEIMASLTGLSRHALMCIHWEAEAIKSMQKSTGWCGSCLE